MGWQKGEERNNKSECIREEVLPVLSKKNYGDFPMMSGEGICDVKLRYLLHQTRMSMMSSKGICYIRRRYLQCQAKVSVTSGEGVDDVKQRYMLHLLHQAKVSILSSKGIY